MTDIRSLIALPDPDAPVGSAAHISSYPEFSKGTEVMAIYESTTSFYRAVVVAGPKDPWQGGRVGKFGDISQSLLTGFIDCEERAPIQVAIRR
jgi:hypothetical protein